ncbi:MAG: LytTR family DNA-binding domain-containing protein [Ferruginibacter sp.]
MKLLVTDNEAPIRNGIRQLLQAYCPEITVIEEAAGVREGLEKINSFQPDILLLDVEMDDGTGFDLLRQVQHPSFQLIFATAHNKYATDAFRFSAIDYLLKPVDPGALQESIRRAAGNIRGKGLERQIEILMQQLSGKQPDEKRIVLKDIDNIYFLKVQEILYCVAEGTYTRFYTQAGNPIMVSKNLKEYENLLEPLGFLRTHHSYLVNPGKVIRYDKKDGGALVLENGQEIPVSKRRRDDIMQILENR